MAAGKLPDAIGGRRLWAVAAWEPRLAEGKGDDDGLRILRGPFVQQPAERGERNEAVM